MRVRAKVAAMQPLPPDDFATALEAARCGDEAAWRYLHASLASALLAYARAHGATEPEDVVGEVFASVARGLPGFRGNEEAFRGWVFLVARHRIIDERRRRGRRPVDPRPPDELPTMPAPVDTAQEALGALESQRLRRLLERLTPDQRDVLLLRVVADRSVEDTARIMGRRSGAVKQLQARALAALRRAIEEEAVTG
jgi:RNA polymerase sigma-70 factor (ECF subfamily)